MENIRHKVLLIEDDEVDQVAFKRLVEKEVLLYDYSLAGSVSEAKKILSSETFEAIIIDYNLGDGTAFDIFNLVNGTPFVIVTGAGDEEIAVKAMKAGAYDYLIKDVNRNYLKVLPLVIEKAILNKKSENHLKLLSYAIMGINDSVYFTDMENKILFVNNAFYKTYGYNAEDIIGKHCNIFLEDDSSNDDLRNNSSETDKGTWRGETYHKHKNGILFPIYLSKSIIIDENEKELGIVNIVRDITEKKAIEQRLEYMAHFDDLTGLPNRVLFYDRIDKSLARAKRDNLLFAILFLDLDKFKAVNDTFGHNVGDSVLKITAKRLSNCIREADTVARLGGDEFAIILTTINEPQNAVVVVQRIIAYMGDPFHIKKGTEHTIGISIGITIYPFDGDDADTLIKNADTAMYHAKANGNGYRFYNSDMNTTAFRRFTIETKLREAIKQKEFLLYYQPQVDIVTSKIVGIEAFIWWLPPDHELLSPDKFISIAEESELIIPISEWAIHTACSQNKTWQNAGISPIPVTINISSRQFKQQNLTEIITQLLHETGLDPHFLEIELTERILMRDEEFAIAKLEAFAAKGIRLSIDGFGTGYSSIKYLKCFPIHKLKIDKSFVDDITTNHNNRAISEAIITMAHSLQLKVIAEGVKTVEQLKILRSLGCDEIQGYLFSEPLPAEKFTNILVKGCFANAIPEKADN